MLGRGWVKFAVTRNGPTRGSFQALFSFLYLKKQPAHRLEMEAVAEDEQPGSWGGGEDEQCDEEGGPRNKRRM